MVRYTKHQEGGQYGGRKSSMTRSLIVDSFFSLQIGRVHFQ